MKAAETVFLRNKFYEDKYKQTRTIFFMTLVVNVVMACLISYIYIHPKPIYYFSATNDFRLIRSYPLSDPVVSDAEVLQWAGIAVQKAYNIDYVHWEQQMGAASANFTISGWHDFLDKLKKSNNLNTVLRLQMVTDTTLTGAPVMMSKALLPSGYYAWKIKIPILVTYNSAPRDIKMPISVTLIVVRQPVSDFPYRIAINNFIASTQ